MHEGNGTMTTLGEHPSGQQQPYAHPHCKTPLSNRDVCRGDHQPCYIGGSDPHFRCGTVQCGLHHSSSVSSIPRQAINHLSIALTSAFRGLCDAGYILWKIVGPKPALPPSGRQPNRCAACGLPSDRTSLCDRFRCPSLIVSLCP